jgi:uncharacterized protein (TIGR00251 family)
MAVRLNVKVVPGASRTRFVGRYGQGIKVQVAAPPEGGKANAAVIALLAQVLNVAANAVEIAAGHSSPRKVLLIRGLDPAALQAKLAALE